MQRGKLWWADLAEPDGSAPGYRRPVLILQADAFTQSRIATVIVAVITSNLRLAAAPGNILLSAQESGSPQDSGVNVSQIITIDKMMLEAQVGHLSYRTMTAVEDGVRLVLDLYGFSKP